MGSRYVLRALTHTYGERMPAAERLTLVAMAYHALDGKGKNPDHLPGTYWGGHKQLAREVYGSESDNAIREVRRHIANLIARRLIKAHDTEAGYNRAYLLFPEGEGL
jgi:hypothetical protein